MVARPHQILTQLLIVQAATFFRLGRAATKNGTASSVAQPSEAEQIRPCANEHGPYGNAYQRTLLLRQPLRTRRSARTSIVFSAVKRRPC